jgi:tetratricopeptide (TPR) repeat protein
MLKFTYLAQLGLAGTVLVPAVVLEQDPARGLTDVLANTTATIESLERLHSSLTNGDHSQVAATLKATEAPTGDAQLRDERLNYLRGEVSRLQMRWEALEESMRANSSVVKPTPTPPSEPMIAPTAAPTLLVTPLAEVIIPETLALEAGTTGMSEATRTDIIQRLSSHELTAPNTASTEKTYFEPSGFSAHAVRHGRALYKAGRYEDAITLLTAATDQAGAHFWIACSLEKLGRVDDAIAAYDLVIKNVSDAKDAQHAERNRDFLIWKRDFDARISVTTASSTPGENR